MVSKKKRLLKLICKMDDVQLDALFVVVILGGSSLDILKRV